MIDTPDWVFSDYPGPPEQDSRVKQLRDACIKCIGIPHESLRHGVLHSCSGYP
ncbi:hypothetical protein ASZ90_009799 [hydrocarbon metagenome]|uniref:Uncharacterized protein n=1 Tax=hydrocarbon metagenome TaxID=938273 RepID=A0A0W8FHZ5_9ZZZZ